MKKAFALICLALSLSVTGFSQETDLREVFLAAESYFLFEEFNEALPLYLQIHRQYPDNDNINYKIGVCLVNSPYEKEKSIVYLEEAVKNINPKYRENSYKETSAPPEALYYLGTAYRVNNQLDKAKEYYTKFLAQLNPAIYDTTLVKNQIKSCDIAASLMKKPVDFDRQDLDDRINTRFAETNPVVSGDETRMAYISKLRFYDAIFFTEKEDGKWKAPRNIVPELGVDGDVYPTSMSYDGTEMFIYRNDDFIGNLYYTKLINGRWSSLVKLNDNINTKYWESHACMSKDRKTLYFTSNRKGGYGGLDIYKSVRRNDGNWGPAVNLGPKINSPYNDDTPFITEDGSKLYFSSYGHYNMGGYDIFVSKKLTDSTWAEPVNIGYPVNTTDDDQFYYPVKDGQAAYYSRITNQGQGLFDIYRYEVYSPDNPRMFPVSGKISLTAEKNLPGEVTVAVVNASGDTSAMVHPGPDGTFRFSVPEGDYSMIFSGDGLEPNTQELSVSPSSPHDGFSIPNEISMLPLVVPLTKEQMDDLLTIRDTLITVDNDEKVNVRFKTDKDTRTVIQLYNDSVLVKTDTIDTDKKRQSYEFVPKPGHNKVVITVEDENGNKVEKSADVVFNQEEKPGTLPQAGMTGKATGNKEMTASSPATESEATISGNLNVVRNLLNEFATGGLSTLLDTLDTEKNGINSTSQLFDYLRANSSESGFRPEDVRDLLKKATTQKDLSGFIHDMYRVSTGNLKKTIGEIDPGKENINTPKELVDHLLDISASGVFKPDDVLRSLGILASGESDDPYFLLKVIKSRSAEDLAGYLDYLKLEKENINTAGDLAVHLYNHAATEKFTKDELLDLLISLAVSKDAYNLREKLSALATGELKNLLDTLDLLSNGIYTAEDLVNFLYLNEDNLNYTSSDVDDLLQKYLDQEALNIEDLRRMLENQSAGKLHDFLSTYDVTTGNFGTEDEFIAFLKDNADSLGFKAGDVDQALINLAYDGDVDDIIRKLSEYATPALKDRLHTLGQTPENTGSVEDLLRDLFDNAGRLDYTLEDVTGMLSGYSTMNDLQDFLRKLAEVSKGDTRDFILSIDTGKLGIHTRQDLVNYLLDEADKGNVDKTEIIHAILKAAEIPASEILTSIKYQDTGNIGPMIESLPDTIETGDDLFSYLLDQASSSGDVTTSEILNLFSNYLKGIDLHIFHHKLLENATGNLHSFILQTDPAKENIGNVSDYIGFLLDKAAANGFSKDDVYNLLARIIEQDNLTRFIEHMKEFAGSNLKKALESINPGKLNITNAEQLLSYLAGLAGKYGFDPSEIWDILLKIALKQSAGPDTGDINLDNEFARDAFNRGIKLTVGILVLEALAIFILILFARKRKKKDEAETSNPG